MPRTLTNGHTLTAATVVVFGRELLDACSQIEIGFPSELLECGVSAVDSCAHHHHHHHHTHAHAHAHAHARTRTHTRTHSRILVLTHAHAHTHTHAHM